MAKRSIILVSFAVVIALAIFATSSAGTEGGGRTHNHATAFGEPQGAAEPPLWGDIDCNGGSDSVDALKGLQFIAGLAVQQQPDCPEIGTNAGPGLWGDWDCDGTVNSVDALQVLRNLGGLAVVQTQPCPEIGEPIGPEITVVELVLDPDWKDYGDAPDGTATGYSSGAANGSFPTQPENGGPSHPFPLSVWLGDTATAEEDPLDGGDADDGLQTFDLSACATSYALVTINGGGGSDDPAYVNLLADWNRDGDWEDSGCAEEWAIQNEEIDVSGGGLIVTVLEFTGGEQVAEFWSRLVVSTQPFDPEVGGELAGETEDYLVTGDSLTLRVSDAVGVPAGGGSGDSGGEHFFCKSKVYAHDGFTATTFAIEQGSESKKSGFSATQAKLSYGQPQTLDGMGATGVGVMVQSVYPLNTEDGRLSLMVVMTVQKVEDPPERLEGPFIIPIVVEGQSNKGAFRSNLRCGLYIDHSEGGGMSGLDGFRGGPGRSGKSPGSEDPKFIVISHGDRVAINSDANVDKETADASNYDPDSLRVFDENGTLLNNDTLPQAAGIKEVIVPTKGRGILIDTVEDNRHPSTQTLIIRLKGKDEFNIPFTDYFRIIINHDDDTSTKTLIKKLLDDGVALHTSGEDEAFAVTYAADGTSIRSKIPPFAGLVWDERTECVLGQGGLGNGVRDVMFGSLAYVVDYVNGGSDVLLKRDSGEISQPSSDDDEDEDCFPLVTPPDFEFLTNNGPSARIRVERGNICAGRLVAAEFELSQPGIPFGLFESEIEEAVLREAGSARQPSGTTFKTPIPGGQSHRYPNCFKMGGENYGIVASTPGDQGRSVLAYVPYTPCAMCRAGHAPQGSSGFILLEPVGENDHMVRAAVSPDGTKIAFEYDVNDELGQMVNAQVYVGGFDASIPMIIDPVPVTSAGLNGVPTWSPDSQQIAFVSTRGGNLDIWMMNADGSEQTNLTNSPDVEESFPSWQSP